MNTRWPSARPDAIVPEVEYERARQSVVPAKVAKALNKRVPWERGLHQNYTGESFTLLLVRRWIDVRFRRIWRSAPLRQHRHGKTLASTWFRRPEAVRQPGANFCGDTARRSIQGRPTAAPHRPKLVYPGREGAR